MPARTLYPTLYLLHGAGDGVNAGKNEWRGYGLDAALDELLAQGKIKPMIVVLPEGMQSYWVNHANGGPRWADYVFEDVVPHVDHTFATDPRPQQRAVGGLSMGGHGALQFALTHPELFRVAGAHSPSLREYERSPEFFGDPQWFLRFDPRTLAQRGATTKGLTVWIDVGTRDRWRTAGEDLARVLEQHGADVRFHVLDGAHEGEYWRAHLRRYIEFYSEQFSRR
jgi:enterochelin esterase-like enzyme